MMPRALPLQLAVGASYPLRGLGFVTRHGLWRLALAAVAVNVVLLVACLGLGYVYVLPWVGKLVLGCVQTAPAWVGAAPLAADSVAARAVAWAVWVGCLPLLVLASAVVVLVLGQVVASPVLDRLSERSEAIVLGTQPPPWRLRSALDASLLSLTDVIWGLLTNLGFLLPRLALGLLPGLGALVLWGLGASLLAHEFVGLPMTRRLVGYRARWRAVMAQPGLALGFGGSAYALLFVPGLNLVLLPLACVGGTLLYCDLVRAGLVQDPAVSRPPVPS